MANIFENAAAKARAKLARMVALSATFAAGDDYNTARARVYLGVGDDDAGPDEEVGNRTPPYAVIDAAGRTRREVLGTGAGKFVIPSGEIELYLVTDPPAEALDNVNWSRSHAEQYFDSIVAEVIALSDTDDADDPDGIAHLLIRDVDQQEFDETDPSEWQKGGIGRFWFAIYLFSWGNQI